MKRIVKKSIVLLLLLSTAVLSVSCKKEQPEPPAEPKIQIAQMKEIAELASLECYYHNVAKVNEENASGFWIFKKDKTFWIEYSGVVKIGIDASKLKIDVSGTDVRIILPQAVIQGYKVDENSLTSDSFYVASGSAKPSAKDEIEALKKAEQDMKSRVSQNDELLNYARQNAKKLLEDYVKNIGEHFGIVYNISFVDAFDEPDDVSLPVTTVQPSANTPETKK